MKKRLLLIAVFLWGFSLICFSQNPFTAGNIVVYRLGANTTTLGVGVYVPVFLDEYTPSGTLVQTIAMPTTGNQMLLGGAPGTGQGHMNLSANGKYLVVPGSNSSNYNGVIGLVDFNGVTKTSQSLFQLDISSATSDDGTNIWMGGNFGVGTYYTQFGNLATTQLNTGTVNNINITSGQLYVSQASSPRKVGTVGTGLPTTSGQTISTLPGLPSGAPKQFAFADLDPGVPGVDVLYAADQVFGGPGGIIKYSLVNGSWVSNGSVGTTNDLYDGLTIKVSGNSVTIFATRQGGNNSTNGGGDLIKLVDASGYNGTLTGTSTVIAITNTDKAIFKGVALVPQPAPFTTGNIAVYRVGDGSTTLTSSAAAVYLDEYTTLGTLVQSILMPTAISGNNKVLTSRGNKQIEGMLNVSADGKFLVVPGYNATIGTTTATARIIGLVDFNGTVNTATGITDYASTPTSATSSDGINIWLGGSGAIRYTTVGASTSVLLNPSSAINFNITNNQLYASTSDPFIGKVGTGLPTTTSQTFTSLPGLPPGINADQFAFADIDPSVAGPDVLYVASQNFPTGGGIQKYSLIGTTWVLNGAVGTTADVYTGLTIKVSGTSVTIFATRQGPNNPTTAGGEIVKLSDNSGYNGTLSGTPTVIATVAIPNNMAFRGIAPVPSGCQPVTGLLVTNITPTQGTINWNTGLGGANYEYAVSTNPVPPVSGTITSNTSATATGLLAGLTYYGHVRRVCSANSNSEWATISFVTSCKPPATPLVSVSISSLGITIIKWNQVFGAASYEYFISTSSTPPTSGIATTDTSFQASNLNSITQYYIHVRSNCGSSNFSAWTSKPFNTFCFMPALNLAVLQNNAGAKWKKVTNAVKYEYALTYYQANPLSGSYTTDTSYQINDIVKGAGHYFHVRSVCSNGAVSDWSTVAFHTPGMEAYPNPVSSTLRINVYGTTITNGQISIADAMGRMVKKIQLTNNTIDVDLRGLAAGIYLVRYDDGTNKYMVKVMKQ
jgi:hypothetical protein